MTHSMNETEMCSISRTEDDGFHLTRETFQKLLGLIKHSGARELVIRMTKVISERYVKVTREKEAIVNEAKSSTVSL